MKHYLLQTANGLHTPPCNNSHGKSSHFFNFRFSLFTPLLVLFLLIVGNSPAWASTNYFTPEKTLYFYVDGDCKNWGNNQFAALFYYQNNENRAYGYENENYSARQFIGNSTIGSTNRIKCSKINDNYYSVVIPSNGTANIGYVRLIHLNTDDGWCHQAQQKVSADSFTGTNNCIKFSAWDNGTPTGYEAYNSGECITSACSGGEPEPEPLSGDYYVYGAGGTNWVTGWSKPVEDYKMTISDGVASKTFYNVKGDGLNFKVWNKTTSSDIDWSAYDSSKSENVSCSNCSANNICFNLGSNIHDVTVYTDGSKVWVKAKQHITPNNNWRVTGTFNGWSQNNEQMSNDATNGCKTVTISNISKAYDRNGHGWIKFKLFEGTEWGNSITAKNSTIIGLDSTVIGTVEDDNEGDDGRIIVQVDEPSDITFSYYQYAGGSNIVTVKRTTATPAVPDYQPWSGDSYKDWYLTGDFTKPGVFDAWEQNPSGYKFTTNGDNYQTVSITLDPDDANIFHNHEGHKLTRFEIIRQGTWDNPRINKPHFDASTSNCELKTDWKEAGSNRMSLELTTKSVIKFDIWRWGTTSSSADRKVTITITPVPQVTVTFMANGETFATQVFDKGGKATIPVGAPIRDGYTFTGWDWDFNNTVNENITIDAVWAYKGIESISLNESEHMTWDGNSDFTLTPTYSPSDVITKAVTWSSNNTSVATVNNGIVHAVGAGTATITCTVTDQYDTKKTATCEVTVAACEMSTSDLYTMTVTSYNTYSGNDAILTNLWNESTENDGPASMTICNIRIGNNGGSNEYYAYDNNGNVMIEQRSDNDVDKWYMIDAGTNLYYLKNVYTGKYMYCGPTNTNNSKGNGWTSNGDWFLRSVYTSTSNGETDNYKFYMAKDDWNNDVIVSRADASMGAKVTATDFVLSRQQLTGTPNVWSNVVNNTVSASRGATQGGNSYKGFQSAFVNMENIPNPNYLASQMNGSYYRMNTDATVKANLNDELVKGAVITVRLYADAATSVQLTKENGTEVNTIPLAADTEFEYSYTVNNASPLLNQKEFIIKAKDNHAGIASIKVTHTYVANPSSPELSWETDLSGVVTQSALGSTFQHIASSALSLGAIHYASSDEAVATVAANGTVTPHSAGTTTITATIAADGCYKEASISYNITLTEASLQEAIDATPVDGTLTLTHNYSENAVINKAITLDANGHTIGDLTVEFAGDLTLSSKLTVRDFTIWAKAGNTSIPAASGQVRNASELNVNGNAYFLYTVDPSGQIHYGWYDFTVPFPINIVSGIKGIQGSELKEDFRNGVDYAVMEYFGDKQAQGQYPYKKFSGIMQPNKLYTITLSDYNTLRMQKTADGALVAGESVTLNQYTGGDAINANWNGVGNGTLHHADAGISGNFIQVYQSGNRTFLTVNKADYSLVVGSAFMVQETGTMILNQANGNKPLLAPSRYESAPATAIQIASEGKPFSDQLFITASETGGQAYTPGVDVAKAGELGSASVPQIWTNAYNSSLCVHEAQLINGKAQYKLSIYAPVAGAYTLTSKNIPADYSLYLTQNGMIVSELSDTYTLDLSKGITTEYGLLLAEIYNSPTGIENTQTDKTQTTKIIRNGVLYILHNGKVYNAQGAKVK
ncbi:MAG: Ig-like domain-containing protein [Paludibacteraceae bacterium]|nr:Ig-like domain-containing protein [Paludibacteraceae bacterium]